MASNKLYYKEIRQNVTMSFETSLNTYHQKEKSLNPKLVTIGVSRIAKFHGGDHSLSKRSRVNHGSLQILGACIHEHLKCD